MHFHYYTLKHLCQYLQKSCIGTKILSCISQNRNEMVIELEHLYLRVGCHTPLSFILPISEFYRAKKNVVELFQDMYGLAIKDIRVIPYERVMVIELEKGYQLILKMHGIGANVLLGKDGEIVQVFNNQYENDWLFKEEPGPYREKAIPNDHDFEVNLPNVQEILRNISPIYDKNFSARFLHIFPKHQHFSKTYHQLLQEAQEDTFYIVKEPRRIRFQLFPPSTDYPYAKIQGVRAALNFFMRCYYQYAAYQKQYNTLDKDLKKPHKKFQKIYTSYLKNVAQLEQDRNPEEIGHIIMANLHAIEPNQKKVVLEDFYQGGTISIKLKPKLSPQENAKNYYDKHKQRRSKLKYLKSQLEDIENKLLAAEEELEIFQEVPTPQALSFDQEGFNIEELKSMKKLTRSHEKEQNSQEQTRHPFRTFEKQGYQIFVGKSARNNDELSFHFANKEDLWLHAKDVTGSHVIIKQKSGQNIPAPVLEYAAQLAAFYSKRKNDTLVPVQYTLRKYIRKRKGEAAGKVVVSREDVIMVEPIRGE